MPMQFDQAELDRLVAKSGELEDRRVQIVSRMKDMHAEGETKAWDSADHLRYNQIKSQHDLVHAEAKMVQAAIDAMKGVKPKTDAEVNAITSKPLTRWMRKGLPELSADERNQQKDLLASFGAEANTPGAKFVIPFNTEGFDVNGQVKVSDLKRRERGMPQNAATSPQQTGLESTIVIPIDQDYFDTLGDYGGAMELMSTMYTPDGNDRKFLIDDDGNTTSVGPTATWTTAQGENAMPDSMDQVTLSVQMYTTGWADVNRYSWEDLGFDPGAWVNRTLYRRMGKKLEAQAANGTGAANNPRGFITAAEEFVTKGATGKFIWDDTIDIEHSINRAWLKGEAGLYGYPHVQGKVCYVTSWPFFAVLKKMKDSQNRPLFLPGYHSGDIYDMNGYPIHICQEFGDTTEAANKRPIVFGSMAYMVQRYAGAGFMIEQHYDSATALSNNLRYLGRLRWGCGIVGPVTGSTPNLKTPALKIAKIKA